MSIQAHSSVGLLNPDVQYNHVPPSEAYQIEISRNIILAVLGAIVWDILAYIPEDIKIVRRSGFQFVIFCFVLSRPFAVGFALINAIERAVPFNNLNATALTSPIMCMLSMITSSYLFLRRVQAVYADTRWVQWLFFVLWVIAAASDIVIPLGVHPESIPGTHYYLGSDIHPYDALSVFTLIFYDTSVLLAISYKIASEHRPVQITRQVPWYALIYGKTLPRLSRSILRGGQQYYLITVGMSIIAAVTVSIPSVPQIFKPTFPTVMVSIMSSMACRVFRNTKLFDLNARSMGTRTSNIPAV